MRNKKIVRDGYNAIAARYFRDRARNAPDLELLKDFAGRLPPGACVLDAGCGAGVPIAEFLSRSFLIVGLDFAPAQVRLARQMVPLGEFLQGDIVVLPFREATFDGIVCTYAMIHVPREEHPRLVAEFRRTVKPSGLLLLCMGANDLPEDAGDFFGTPMYWSHYDAHTNLEMLRVAGFEILWSRLVEDATSPGSTHLFVMARAA